LKRGSDDIEREVERMSWIVDRPNDRVELLDKTAARSDSVRARQIIGHKRFSPPERSTPPTMRFERRVELRARRRRCRIEGERL